MARDLQTLGKGMRTIYRLCPTGVEDDMFYMALAVHLKNIKPTLPDRNDNGMYNLKAFDTYKSQYPVACKKLQKT